MAAESSPEIALIIPVGPGDTSWHGLLPFLARMIHEPATAAAARFHHTGHAVARSAPVCQLNVDQTTPSLPNSPRTAPRRALDGLATHAHEASGLAGIEICFSACEPRPAHPGLAPHWRWLEGPAGRARQLNLGSQSSGAVWLWWLHADSRPRAEALPALRASIASAPAALHWFPLAFADGPWLAKLNAAGANWRSRVLGLPFGDQGLCLSRANYQRLQGFDEALARGEDLDLVVRAQHAGIALAQVASPLTSSARRYRQHGWLRTTCEHLWLTWRQTRAARRRCASD